MDKIYIQCTLILLMLACLRTTSCILVMAGLECKNWGEMSVDGCELAFADDVYIKSGSGSNISAQTFKVCRFTNLSVYRYKQQILFFTLKVTI